VILCLVTDRRRLSEARADDVRSTAALVDLAHRAVDAGVDLIHVRERDLDAAAQVELAADIVRVACGSTTRVVVNDRVDVAIASGAHGVHLRADSISAAAARELAPPPFLIGRSVHTTDEARQAADADYLIAGTVFPSRSKPDARSWLGTDGLRAIAAATHAPVLGIGGITLDRVADVAATGAAGIAAIALFTDVPASSLRALVADVRSLFDSARSAP
jgi:thiamine-phosphate diphosphorylase